MRVLAVVFELAAEELDALSVLIEYSTDGVSGMLPLKAVGCHHTTECFLQLNGVEQQDALATCLESDVTITTKRKDVLARRGKIILRKSAARRGKQLLPTNFLLLSGFTPVSVGFLSAARSERGEQCHYYI